MCRKVLFFSRGFGLLVAALVVAGCTRSTPTPTLPGQVSEAKISGDSKPDIPAIAAADEAHGHKAGAHGGIIVSLGRDSYHVEAIVTKEGELRLYTLSNDESRVIDVEIQQLLAYVKTPEGSDSSSIEVKALPQPGDADGKASLFVAQLPEALIGQSIDVTIPNITIGGERFRLGFTTKTETHGLDAMPAKVANEAEKQLYLTPGGAYTQADIEANGNVTASKKFAGFQATHDLKPKNGDKICPVTLTKANPKCAWIVGGKNYEFCCPPCVDEFVAMAKSKPDEVKTPDEYVKRPTVAEKDLK